MEYFENLEPLLRTFWYIAIPATLIFIIQSIMTFTGTDAHDGLSADFHGDLSGVEAPFQLFSLRNLINFLLGFSWTGISFFFTIENSAILILISIAVGALFVYLFFLIIKQVQKLAEDNSFSFQNTLNKSADVYLSIPAHKSGKGKIMISVNGSMHELQAMTEGDKIETNAVVKVVRIENGDILIVEKI